MESPVQSRSWSGNSWWASSAGKQEIKEKLETNSPCECQEVAAIRLLCSNTNPTVTFPAPPPPHPPPRPTMACTGEERTVPLTAQTPQRRKDRVYSHISIGSMEESFIHPQLEPQQNSFWNANTLCLWLDWKFEGILLELQNKRGWMPEEHYSPGWSPPNYQ